MLFQAKYEFITIFEFITIWRVVQYTSWLPVPSNAAGVVGKHFALHVRAHKVLIVPHHLHQHYHHYNLGQGGGGLVDELWISPLSSRWQILLLSPWLWQLPQLSRWPEFVGLLPEYLNLLPLSCKGFFKKLIIFWPGTRSWRSQSCVQVQCLGHGGWRSWGGWGGWCLR